MVQDFVFGDHFLEIGLMLVFLCCVFSLKNFSSLIPAEAENQREEKFVIDLMVSTKMRFLVGQMNFFLI